MQQRIARIHLNGHRGTIEIDGHDISRYVRGLCLTADVGNTTRLVLDLIVHTVDVDGDMHVVVPDKTATLLADLGWTPPVTKLAGSDHDEDNPRSEA